MSRYITYLVTPAILLRCTTLSAAVTFGAPTTYFLGSSSIPTAVATCDLDNDGWTDVVVVETGYDRVSVLFNDGVGFGALETPIWVDVGNAPISVACRDIDGDRDDDIIVANFQGSFLSILRNEGKRMFTHVPLEFGENVGPRNVTSCDLNNDSLIDLITANDPTGVGGDTFTVFLGLGGGTFASPVSSPTDGVSAESVSCEDLNGDGNADLAIANTFTDDVSVLLGHGDGTFAIPAIYAVADGPQSLSTCNVDGDNSVDIVVNAVHGDTISLLRNNGDGTFAAFETIGVVNGPEGVVCYDVDRDGDSDILGGGDDAFVFLNDGTGTFDLALHFPIGVTDPRRVAVAFLNDDCSPDLLLAASGSNELSVLLYGDLGVDLEEPGIYTVGNFPGKIISGDLDDDGFPDLITANGGQPTMEPSLSLLMNNQDGTFAEALDLPINCTQTFAAVASDFNGDDVADLAATCRGPEFVAVFLNNGDGTFSSAVTYAGSASLTVEIAACDLDGDGVEDLVVAERDADILVYLNNGNGTFAPFYTIADAESSLTDLVCKDLDQDGFPDVAVSSNPGDTGFVFIHYSNGDGTFEPVQSYLVSDGPLALVACDLNGDSFPDLATADNDGCSILTNLGNGSFAASYSVGTGPREELDCCDVDSDGDTDLIVDNANTKIAVLLNNGAGLFQQFAGDFLMGGVEDIVCNDVNANGATDVATTNHTGTVYVRHNKLLPLVNFLIQPEDQTVPANAEVTFEAALATDEPVSYQWFKDGIMLAGEEAPALTIYAVMPNHAGDYTALGTGDCFARLSEPGTLVVVGEIPTVSEYGLIALSLLVLIAGTLVLRQRRREVQA